MARNRPIRKLIISTTCLAVAAGVIGFFIRPGVMPLDAETLEQFQVANSREVAALQADPGGLSYYQIASTGFRRAVSEVGSYPSETVLYWLSPQFREDIRLKEPLRYVDLMRLTDSLLAVAFGDGCPDEEFESIIANFTPAVREAARARRGLP